MTVDVYYRPHNSRIRENQFFKALMGCYSQAVHHAENYPIPDGLFKNPVSRDQLARCLENDSHLPVNARQRSLEALQSCPADIFVMGEHGNISVDMVIVDSNGPTFIEFHEKQHRRLSDNRPRMVYDQQGRGCEVPRALQRLVRDVWRCLYLKPYSVVWWDWFETHGQHFELQEGNDYFEFALDGRFNFKDFLEKNF
ncbi:MAG: hypothetical protein DRH08_08070 [Deltaproteobacteria bacterium]|nr:MAG: hypothetical protein DRH08_08070 [Deltaproteobacteria bacterium]